MERPIAERRYAYAQSTARDGDWAAAAEVLEQALELAPNWAPALHLEAILGTDPDGHKI